MVDLGSMAPRSSCVVPPELEGPGWPLPILDRREDAYLSKKARPHTRLRDVEPWALVLHQMAFNRGCDPTRYDGITAHYKILSDGTIIWSHDDNVRLPAAGGLNHGSWSVEFAGNFPSQPGSTDPRRFYRPLPSTYLDRKTGEQKRHPGMGMDQVTAAQVNSGRFLIAHLMLRGLRVILAHRQGGPERQNDPGPDIWYRIAEWAIRYLGLEWGGPDFAVAGGKPIPPWWRTWGDQLGGPDLPVGMVA